MGQRICIFVDGENFRHSIVGLFAEFSQADYLPHNAEWEKFFEWLTKQIDGDGNIVRTYWYVIDEVDYYPYRFPRIETEPEKLKIVLCKDKNCKERLAPLRDQLLTDEMKTIVGELKTKKQQMSKRFAGWSTLQNAISTKHRRIEFRKAGAIQYNLFTGELGTEKAVDVKLATDMIMLRNIYDTAIIVSGDQDYVPAVKVVKDSGKHVINVAFETRGGKLLPGGAWRLNQTTDWSLKIPYNDFRGYLNFDGAERLL